MQKLFFTLLVTFSLCLQASFAQSYILSGVEKTDKEGMQYEILGKVANNYWIYKKNDGLYAKNLQKFLCKTCAICLIKS